MEIFLSVLYLIFMCVFMIAYTGSFVINLVRAIKINNSMKVEYNTVKAKVLEVIKDKKRVFIKVEYVSPESRISFIDIIEMTEKEFKDQYYVDQELNIYYPNVKDFKRVTCFPTYLEGQPIKIKSGTLVSDFLLAIVSIFMVGWVISLIINLGGFYIFNDNNTSAESMQGCGSFTNALIYLLPVFMYVTTIPYLLERFTMASKEENQNYLKLYGAKCLAEVKTFKFSSSKNEKGTKESMMTIEFYDSKGDLIKAHLNSFMYTETQEQYVNILYDPKNPKNVVYMRR